ncbi:SHOCT domain-containing protein [Azospirillum doebereinerae]|uniref:SHOCT domain-containing protein n=1 Tax=Azospirillum doebereinerae TaxID=92933 RepID=A0A433J9S3_9PROT|nr:SHOCT domain-containing protein [Azospirillum doebereinerae]RUQ71493.1 SHOCT domain-containing protein [Azospirillum doebereinerae]
MKEDKNLYTVFFKKNKADSDEKIIIFVNGFIVNNGNFPEEAKEIPCVLILTSKGIRFYATGLRREFFVKISMSDFASIEYCSYLIRDGVKLFASGKTIDFRVREKRQLSRMMYDALKSAHAAHKAASSCKATPEATKKDDVETSLDTLGRLRDAGYITQAEFKEKREAILIGLGKLAEPGTAQSSATTPLVPSASNGYLRPDEGRKPRVWVFSP